MIPQFPLFLLVPLLNHQKYGGELQSLKFLSLKTLNDLRIYISISLLCILFKNLEGLTHLCIELVIRSHLPPELAKLLMTQCGTVASS